MRTQLLALVLAAALTGAACGDDDVSTAGEAGGAIADDAPTDVGEDAAAPDDGPDAALAFFRSTEQVCIDHADATGNVPPPSARYDDALVGGPVGDGTWTIIDGAGVELVVDEADGVVYPTDGPEGVLPREYSFGCPPEVYLGTLDE